MRVFRQIFCLKNLISFLGLLRDVQAKIETRSLPMGGWTTGNGSRASVETTCYALMALHDRQGSARDNAINLLLRTQNPDGSWPAFDGDDPEGCWTTALVLIALHFVRCPSEPVEKSLVWLLDNAERLGKQLVRISQISPDAGESVN